MNSHNQSSPRYGDSLVTDTYIHASGRTPVFVLVQETKIKVTKSTNGVEREESRSPISPRHGDSILTSTLLNKDHST